ncbi:hypothetical protein STEG23_012385, partial [Scotinomys teguina]
AAPETCRRRPQAAPQRTRWRSWNTTLTRSTSTPMPPRCASSPPRRASRRRRPRNGLSSAWPSGGGQKACPPNAALFANFHGDELLVWFQASGFCYTINAGPSMRPLLDFLLLS